MFYKTRLFRGQLALLLAVLTTICFPTDFGVGIAILTMGLAAYWIITAEAGSVGRTR